MENAYFALPPTPPPKNDLDIDDENLFNLENTHVASLLREDWSRISSQSGLGLGVALTTNEAYFGYPQNSSAFSNVSSCLMENKRLINCADSTAVSSPCITQDYMSHSNPPLSSSTPPFPQRTISLRVPSWPLSKTCSSPPPVPPKDPFLSHSDSETPSLKSQQYPSTSAPLPPVPPIERLKSYESVSFIDKRKDPKLKSKARRLRKRFLAELSKHFDHEHGTKAILARWTRGICIVM